MIDVALKEWAVVCEQLIDGGLSLLIRKGGIHEVGGPGVFEMEHDRFALFPSWAHQRAEMLQDGVSAGVRKLEEPAEVSLEGLGHAVRIWRVRDRGCFNGLEDLHCWSKAHIDMRFEYKPDRPVYVVGVRVYRLKAVRVVVNDAAYGGCRSWVALKPTDAVDEAGAEAVLSDDVFRDVVERLDAALG